MLFFLSTTKKTILIFFGNKGFIESQLLIHENKLELFLSEYKYLFKSIILQSLYFLLKT